MVMGPSRRLIQSKSKQRMLLPSEHNHIQRFGRNRVKHNAKFMVTGVLIYTLKQHLHPSIKNHVSMLTFANKTVLKIMRENQTVTMLKIINFFLQVREIY